MPPLQGKKSLHAVVPARTFAAENRMRATGIFSRMRLLNLKTLRELDIAGLSASGANLQLLK
jgi:hypothetical protein